MSSEREVRIYGQIYRVRGESPEKIGRAAGYLDELMTRLLGGSGQGLSTKSAVLVALNVAEESLSYRDEVENLLHNATQRVDELLGLLPE